jgi:hypothetical protein
LLKIAPNIDPTANNNEAFIKNRYNGHLNVAKWLFKKFLI